MSHQERPVLIALRKVKRNKFRAPFAQDLRPHFRSWAIDKANRFCRNSPNSNRPKYNMTASAKTISTESLQPEGRTFPPPSDAIKRAHINAETYMQMYERSVQD